MTMSLRERNIWITLFIDTVIAVYYFSNLYHLNGFTEIYSDQVWDLMKKVILFSIVANVVLEWLLDYSNNPEEKDERDLMIENRGNRFAYYSLYVLCCIIIGHFTINQGIELWLFDSKGEDKTILVLHTILISLFIASFVKAITQLVSYRRGY